MGVALVEAIYPGTPIEFLPWWISDTIRIATWAASLVVVVQLGLRAARWRSYGAVPWGRAALILLLGSDMIVNVERWGQPLTWEKAPFVIMALVCVILAMRDEDRRRGGDPE